MATRSDSLSESTRVPSKLYLPWSRGVLDAFVVPEFSHSKTSVQEDLFTTVTSKILRDDPTISGPFGRFLNPS